ncbi:MAG: hypothetical protein J5J06_05545 [Phycisphaerae bacterium]|nr:hypothetical protein [Phycisphaerae bacterium]
MNDATRARMIQQTRQEIMIALLHTRGIPFRFDLLCHALLHLNLPDDEVVKRDLEYLAAKGYVRWTNEADYLPWSRRMFELTPAGDEVANRITHDPAVGL